MHDNANESREFALYVVLIALTGAIFVVDLLVPFGTAVWIVYLLPPVLAYLAWRPIVPPLAALVSTIAIAIGFLADLPSISNVGMAQINRAMGVSTVWILALIGYHFVRNKVAVRREEWLQTAQSDLARRMMGDVPPEVLAERICAFLAERLGAQAVAFFAREDDSFVRIAGYGIPSAAPVPVQIRRGDGLIGQAAIDNRILTLRNVPDNYLYFGSSFGFAKPASLLIAPTRKDNEANAVIELGFPRPVSKDAAELLERVAGKMGIALRSAQYRTRLEDLLEETRRQSEELRRHGEELAATNEELQEQSRALQDSQQRLERQQAELEEVNAHLEEQTQLLEAQRDDLTRAQTALREHARDLASASRYKSEFLANMSHELRTPLNALLIMARLLAENRGGNLNDEQVGYAQLIESSGNDLLTLINDILDLSKIEAGKLDLQPGDVALGPLAEKLVRAFQPLGDEKGVAVRLELAPDLPPTLESDGQRLEQVLKNFLSNAVKFTERGEVVLRIGQENDGRIAFAVEDSGIGIAEEEQAAIFDAFHQADGTIDRRYGGTGLGLSISRELANLLGGEIRLRSAPGEGSTFTIVLPRRFAGQSGGGGQSTVVVQPRPARTREGGDRGVPAGDLAAQPPRPGVEDDRLQLTAGRRVILVVEDDLAFARILLDLAHELGFQCIVTSTADDGVLAARQYLPDAVILDMALPDHSGMTVLERMKRDLRTRHIPVHVVSVDDYTDTAMSLGAVGYMLKPVKREELAQALERLESRLTQPLRRVLIVEDDPAQRQGLGELLAAKDVETIGSATAAEALDRLRRETFDCMVLDMTLPDASGFDLLDRLNEDEEAAFPPVIVYTARELSPDEELRLRRYSKSIIIKGAKSPERLIDEVTLFLHQVVADLPERQRRMLATSLNRDALLDGRRILVVEDDVRNVFAITSIFEPHGARVQIARNGREALEALDRAGSGVAPAIDLVLMDVMMPEMDGLTAVREIRARPAWKSLPVIMLTAKAMADDHERCLAAGANDYLAKPLDVDKLLSLTRVWMPR
ncbi:Signal transduction histidine kinase [Pseudoxanthobacter soli DSM 19599]|uniref:histidine kinase n=1 Tax=Pseudoxanthobacter soli DSM 19599 TaxID=1123029 RepID=A0A1M7ZN85_9HYPH|nr:response regulator [Pseudoxanthobacter soli]SHO66370.1 Signal transduction histidine kinase [Pseudoxanthobacter soli DSM 19599]